MSLARVITIKRGLRVPTDANLPPLTYTTFLEPAYISMAALPLLIFSALSHTGRLTAGWFFFVSLQEKLTWKQFFFLSRETVF